MAHGDDLVIIASDLGFTEAGMLSGLLASAGIDATVSETVKRTHATILVRAGDAARAVEVARSAGFLGGPGPDEPVDIPEEEWSGRGANPAQPAGHDRASAYDVEGGAAPSRLQLVRERGRRRWALVTALFLVLAFLIYLLV
jgi:hypothetical protein